jgi:hypothetical protein
MACLDEQRLAADLLLMMMQKKTMNCSSSAVIELESPSGLHHPRRNAARCDLNSPACQ